MISTVDEIADIVGRGKVAFDSDIALRRAVERCLEILGEAAKAVTPAVTKAHPEIPWSDLAKVRDRLSHHYHRVDQEQLWIIATVDVPATDDASPTLGDDAVAQSTAASPVDCSNEAAAAVRRRQRFGQRSLADAPVSYFLIPALRYRSHPRSRNASGDRAARIVSGRSAMAGFDGRLARRGADRPSPDTSPFPRVEPLDVGTLPADVHRCHPAHHDMIALRLRSCFLRLGGREGWACLG